MRYERRGFALLAVLWVMTGLAALALGLSLAARQGVSAAQRRTDLVRAAWIAEDCLERARVAISTELSAVSAAWQSLDDVVRRSPIVPGACDVSVRAAGSVLDMNVIEAEGMVALFAATHVPRRLADSLADALLDWRDADDIARPFGAERSWYESRGRFPPRNGPFADVRELARVRGFDAVAEIERVLGVEPGRVAINHAPLVVLAALPGMSQEALSRIVEQRLRAETVRDIVAFAGTLSPHARQELLARYSDLVRLVTVEPDAWILASRARSGVPAVSAVVEVRLVRAGDRAAIVRRRTWVE
ncbi:MAG: general secretion pathway protein GspK [Gemmatimonadaceae bacterium]